jgi:hypothetical protein
MNSHKDRKTKASESLALEAQIGIMEIENIDG